MKDAELSSFLLQRDSITFRIDVTSRARRIARVSRAREILMALTQFRHSDSARSVARRFHFGAGCAGNVAVDVSEMSLSPFVAATMTSHL